MMIEIGKWTLTWYNDFGKRSANERMPVPDLFPGMRFRNLSG